MSDFTTEMDALAAEIAKDLRMAKTELGDKIDGFKALMPYYALLHKSKSKGTGEDDDLPNFDNFARNIHKTEVTDGCN